jgi:hypothetical protein
MVSPRSAFGASPNRRRLRTGTAGSGVARPGFSFSLCDGRAAVAAGALT